MITSMTTSREDSIYEIKTMINSNTPNHLSILQLIRLSRIKLGCVLDQLENFEPSPNALEQLHSHAENITCEIDALLRSTQQFLGR
jgi:hypothetical protein